MRADLIRQAELLADSLRRAGEPEAEVRRRVQRALESACSREANRRPEREAANRFDGCRSVTAVAASIGMKSAALFEWLERQSWVVRGANGKRQPTPWAISQGFAVSRGAAAIRYVQLTPHGHAELARRLVESVDGEPIG
ncbi:hypothetical protein P3T22_005933 [Paraburkholderia sp. GAS348]